MITTTYDPFGASKIRNLLSKENLHLSKQRGQNYLVNRASAEKIVEALPPLKEDQTYFEVGSGLGALTVLLAEKGKVISIEIDRGVIHVLSSHFTHENATLVHADFLKYDFSNHQNLLFISNLPYSISGEALKVFIEENCFQTGVVMLQKEFADRLLASPGSDAYGPLSVIAQNFLTIRKLFFVGKGNFFPVPKVDSLVVLLEKIDNGLPQKEFGRFVKTLFAAKRKTLANNALQSPWQEIATCSYAKDRPDMLSPEVWRELFLSTLK
ncbi:MAG: 16S rRNA (adenine(1518)-N(6)/adenine(1519)-N(6))-dimethyltransferase RsmA [Brevinema sp.]